MARLTGTQLGRYRIGDLLGTGGFAAVYQAHDEGLDNDVAIKVLADNHSFDPEARERFLGEGRMLRRVSHPNVLQVHDVGETDDGQPYLVLQLGDRGSVADRLQDMAEQDRRPTAEDLRLVADALTAGLAALHAVGIVHRDISPANLFLSASRSIADSDSQNNSADSLAAGEGVFAANEQLMIGDLGLAKDLSAGSGLTVGAGTDRYAAPEQRQAFSEVTTVADIFSASRVMVELASDTKLAEAVADAVGSGLEDDPSARPATVADWRALLDPTLPAKPARDAAVERHGGHSANDADRPTHSEDGIGGGNDRGGNDRDSGGARAEAELVPAGGNRMKVGLVLASIVALGAMAGFGAFWLNSDGGDSDAAIESASDTGIDGNGSDVADVAEEPVGAEELATDSEAFVSEGQSDGEGAAELAVIALPTQGLVVYAPPAIAGGWQDGSWGGSDADTFDPQTGNVQLKNFGGASLRSRSSAIAVEQTDWVTMTVRDVDATTLSIRADTEVGAAGMPCNLNGADLVRPTAVPGEEMIVVPTRLLVEPGQPIIALSLVQRSDEEQDFSLVDVVIRHNVDNPPEANNCGS